MSTSKREEVSSHLRYIRQELRDLDQMLSDDGLLPELTELKEVYNSLDALYQLLAGKIKKKPKIEFDDAGDPLCLDCGGPTYQPIGAVGATMTFGPGGVTYGTTDDNDNHWICEDCGYSFDVD